MQTLFRNPFFTLLRQSWYLAVVAAALAWGLGGVSAFESAIKIVLLLGAAVGGVTLMALLYGGKKSYDVGRKRTAAARRFLCPACLHFGRFEYACGKCEEELEPFQVHTEGVYHRGCPHCQQLLFRLTAPRQDCVKAYCKNCFAAVARDLYHQRQVRVFASWHLSAFCLARRGASLRLQRKPEPFRVRAPLFWIFRAAGVM